MYKAKLQSSPNDFFYSFHKKFPYEKKRQLDVTNLVAPRSYIHPHVARHALYQV